jgi:hypothetical protein
VTGLKIVWRETGGPPVSIPTEYGYGTSLIRELVPHELGGTVDLAFSSDGYGADTVYVTHDGGGSWGTSEAFFDGIKNGCDSEEPPGTLCAGGITFHQVHTEPQQLIYDINVCKAPFTEQCEKRTYRMDGWPSGTLTPVQLSG